MSRLVFIYSSPVSTRARVTIGEWTRRLAHPLAGYDGRNALERHEELDLLAARLKHQVVELKS